MSTHEIAIAAVALFALAAGVFAQTGGASSDADHGPYARIALLKPRDGNTVDFEAGYIRHLEWHRQASDPFA